jgi:hypothetical protein
MITHLHLLSTLRISPFASIGLLGVVLSYSKGQLFFIRMCQDIRKRNVQIGFNGLLLGRNSCVIQCSLLHLLLLALVIETPQPSHSHKATGEFVFISCSNRLVWVNYNNTTTRIINGAVYATVISTNINKYKSILMYHHLLCKGVPLYVSTFKRSSWGILTRIQS